VLRAVRSALEQTHRELDVIVVDDGSSDGTAEAVRQFGDRRVRVLRHERARGVAAARNAGIAAARGTWTSLLDDDDLWAPAKVERQLEALRRAPDARWACVGAVEFDARRRIVGWQRLRGTESLLARMLRMNAIPGSASSVLIETELLRQAGGFREDLSYSEDWECWIRLAQLAPLVVVDAPLVAIGVSATSRSHAMGGEEDANERIRTLTAPLRADLGVAAEADPDRHYFARQHLRAGRRLLAAREVLRIRADRRKALVLAGAYLVLPAGWEALWMRLREPRLAPGWRSEVVPWLQRSEAEPRFFRPRPGALHGPQARLAALRHGGGR
jgi:glycosyltransferase involved in cell wall biosynthesis